MAPDIAGVNLRFDWRRMVGRYGSLFVLATMLIAVSFMEGATFASTSNAVNILNQAALTGLIAIGATFPLAAGDFDLSIGYTASLCGVVAGKLMAGESLSIAAALCVAVACGALVGVVNGLVVTVLRVNSLVATLGVGTLAVGVNYAIGGGLPISAPHPESFIQLTLGTWLGLPYPVWVMAVLALVSWILVNRTVTGQSLRAVGGNRIAAHLSGIRVDRVRVAAFVIAGVCAALAGVLLASRSGSAASDGGDGYLLTAYAAAFFGSSVLRDGEFHVIGTVVGVITIAVGLNAIALIGLPTSGQYLFQGAVLILGVGVGTLARRRVT